MTEVGQRREGPGFRSLLVVRVVVISTRRVLDEAAEGLFLLRLFVML